MQKSILLCAVLILLLTACQINKEIPATPVIPEQRSVENVPSNQSTIILNDSKTVENKPINITLNQKKTTKGMVAIFIDKSTYHSLESEITRYAEDIENDLNAEVRIFHDDFSTPLEVRTILFTLKDNGLMGSVLIGDIPMPKFESKDAVFSFSGEHELIEDQYYRDLNSSDFVDSDENGMFEIQKYKGNDDPDWVKGLYWTARIKNYDKDIERLRRYFERNHAYRTDDMKVEKRLFVYSMDTKTGPTAPTIELYEKNIKERFNTTGITEGIYTNDQIDVMVGESKQLSKTIKEEYLQALSKPYEIASINAHGNALTQKIGPGIEGKDISSVQPKPLFYFLLSCSNGDYTQPDYLGAHYLLDGNGLVVIAYTEPTLLGAESSNFFIEQLGKGKTFGDTFTALGPRRYGPMTILGDPTLRLR